MMRQGISRRQATAGLALAGPAFLAPWALRAQASVLRVGVNGADVGTLDPHRAQASPDRGLVSWMFSALVRFPPGSVDPAAIEPDLAERWEASPDTLTWTFHLRPGVRFHGTWGEVTAEDVVYSLARAADPARSSFAADFRVIERVEAVNPATVRVVFKTVVPSALGLLANYQGGFIVSRRADQELGERFRTQPIGSGPFAFHDHVSQQQVVLRAHEGYYRGRPQISEVRYRFINSDATRELAYTAGELDIALGRRDQRWVTRMRSAANTAVEIFRPSEFRTLHINTRQGPLTDIRVREAIARGINVPQLLQFVGQEFTQAGISVVPPGYLGESNDGWVFNYDPTRARALLTAAGHQTLPLKVVVSNISAQQPVMEVIQAQLRRVGIMLEMDVVDHTTYHAQIRRDVSALVFYGAARFPVADTYLSEFYHSRARVGTSTAALNFSHCDVADAEIDAARTEPDPARQKALWATAQQKIHQAICAVPLFDLAQVWLRSRRVDFGYELKGAMNLVPMLTEKTRLV